MLHCSPFYLLLLLLLCIPSYAQDNHPVYGIYKEEDVAKFAQYQGKTIHNVKIIVNDVFEEKELNSFFETANWLKTNTRQYIVRQELLFKEGDAFDTFLIKESERNLRAQRYLRNIKLDVVPQGDMVDVIVSVQDTWTLIPSINYSTGDGSSSKSVGISESNIGGHGKRIEFLAAEESNRKTFEGLYQDPRVWGTSLNFVGAQFLRNDGNRTVVRLADPFRTLLDKTGWAFEVDRSDTVGKLWENGEERFIYRQQSSDLAGAHTWMYGDPEKNLRRYSFGYSYIENQFRDPSSQDFEDVEVDPNDVTQDPALLADNRRYTGPSFGYESLEPRFIKMDYIDRFDRVDDFNIGDNFSLQTIVAPEAAGSIEDALLFNGNRSAGRKFDSSSFIRGEFGFSSRWTDNELSNTLLRAESKYYDVLGDIYAREMFLGKHTLALGYSLDWGLDLDRDREFLLGADTGLRGYESKTFTGDKRFIMNIEDRIHLAEDVLKLMSFGAAAFADIGGTTDGALGDIFQNNLYSDVGVGLRVAFPRSSGGRILRVDLAFPMRDGPDGSNGWEVRVIFAGGPIFSSKLRSESLGAQDANVEVGVDK